MIRKGLIAEQFFTILSILSVLAFLCVRIPMTAAAQDVTLKDADISLDNITQSIAEDNSIPLYLLRRLGLLQFTTPFTKEDGFGERPGENTRNLGERPTFQGNGTFLRVHGLDAQSCNECHVFVSSRTSPPTLGIAGVGGAVMNAIIAPTLIDVADSMDDRVSYVSGHHPDLPLIKDGIADFNGRFANPPFLYGGGGVEALGKEMTVDLQYLLEIAKESPAGTTTYLDTHDVNFGYIISLGGGELDLTHVEGVGPEDITSVPPEEALVVRPFGRKGENFTMRDFDRGAMQFHFGIQPVEVVGENVDPDGDGVVNEITVAEMSVLHIFDVTNPRPVMDKLDKKAQVGSQLFYQIGCTECHRPFLQTNSQKLPLSYPEVSTDPSANVYREIDLVKVGFDKAPNGQGVIVPLFADLKRHDMGDRLAESFELEEEDRLSNREFTTARLWAIADTAPYLHDGRATTLYEAIEFHGGEAQSARDNFLDLPTFRQEQVLWFLGSLRTPDKPNEELF
jgi:hypothetical protein